MQYKWAYPIGHQNLSIDPIIGRTYYQPVQDRNNTIYTDGHEYYLAPADSAIYALTQGQANYTYKTLPNGIKIGTLSLAVELDFALALQETKFFEELLLGRIIYENIDHDAFVEAISALIDANFFATNTPAVSIISTVWKQNKTLAYWLGDGLYSDVKNEFISNVLNGPTVNGQVTPGIAFVLDAADTIGKAGPVATRPANVPANYKLITISAEDRWKVKIDYAFVKQALVMTSLGRLRITNDFTCVSNPDKTSAVYNVPVIAKTGITADATVQNVKPSPSGTKDVMLQEELLSWQHGGSDDSMVEWKYDDTDNYKFKVRIIDRTKSTMQHTLTLKVKLNAAGEVMKHTKGRRKGKVITEPDLTETIQIRDSSYPTTPAPSWATHQDRKETWVARTFSTTEVNRWKQKIISIYNSRKTILNNLGYHLGVPEEIVLAMACHESGGQTCPVRFEPLKPDTITELKNKGFSDFVEKYKLMAGSGWGLDDISFLSDYNDKSRWDDKIRNKTITKPDKSVVDMSITWREYFNVIDSFTALRGLINGRVSPGIAQTVVSTAAESIAAIQKFFAPKKGGQPTVAQKNGLAALGLSTYPEKAKSSELFVWLLNADNSFVAGAGAKYTSKNKTHWDLPRVASAYNAGPGLNSSDIYSKEMDKLPVGKPADPKHPYAAWPNPWGYMYYDESYCLDMTLLFNLLRDNTFLTANNITFKSKLTKQVK